MKHNTHIYLAKKGIEFLYDACNNLFTIDQKPIKDTKKIKAIAKTMHRLLNYHSDDVIEASWAPDDIICDKSVYHTFKLFTEDDFTDAKNFMVEKYSSNGKEYYRAKQGGGLPFKIDHLAKILNDMIKLRKYNDAFSMRSIMYMMIMLSHYVVDAHVPMHCDIRDDNPGKDKPEKGTYYDDKYHGELEQDWDVVTTEYAVKSGCLKPEHAEDYKTIKGKDSLKSLVQFDLSNPAHVKELKVFIIPDNQLMGFIIEVCIRSKERNNLIFPKGQNNPDINQFEQLTRQIYADCIGDLISIWLYIWNY
jgi:hypothetical protein